MRRYIVLVWGMGLLLMGCGGPTAPIVPVGEENVRPTPTVVAVEAVPTLPIAPTTAVVVEAYPALPTAVPATEGYPPPPPALPTSGAYPSPEDQASPNQAAVSFVKASQATDGTWTLEVTVEYANPTAEAYADGWDIITPAGQVIKKDVADPYTQLLEPPSNGAESATHTATGITIPVDVTQFFVRVHDSVNGWSGEMVFVDLNTAEGFNYEVE